MEQEGAIGDVLDLDAVERANGVGDPPEVVGVRRFDRDVADLPTGLDTDDVDRPEQAAGVADRLGEPRERSGAVRHMDPEGGAEGGGEVTCHVRTTPSAASAAISSSSYPASRRTSAVCAPTSGGADGWSGRSPSNDRGTPASVRSGIRG